MVSPGGQVLECQASRRAVSTCASTSFRLSDDSPPWMHSPEEYLNALEEERRKIDAFRRELPICMQLLHDAIESYKEKLAMVGKPSTQRSCHMQSLSTFNDADSERSPNDRCVVEEYRILGNQTGFPFKCKGGDGPSQSMMCKPEWMSSSFLAEANSHSQERCRTDLTVEPGGFGRVQEQAFSTASKPFFHSRNKSGGAFTPFSREKQAIHPTPLPGGVEPMDLALTTAHHKAQEDSSTPSFATLGNVKPANSVREPKEIPVKMASEGGNGPNDSPIRKARRCWSPELHRRFVNALQQLGGSQVATPKQIRELMQVDGLTNDEVKSHLQKYRLHTRRPSSSQTGPPPQQAPPQVVVLGGIWVQPPEYTANAAAAPPALYNPPHHHACHQTTASSQEIYSELGSLNQSQQGPRLLTTGHSSALTFHRNDVIEPCRREESVGDDVESDTSSCRGGGGPQGFHGYNKAVAEIGDDGSQGNSINGLPSRCVSEDEDSRGSDTNLTGIKYTVTGISC